MLIILSNLIASNFLLTWQFSYYNHLDDPFFLSRNTNRKTKTFSEILNEKARSGGRIGYNLHRYVADSELEEELTSNQQQPKGINYGWQNMLITAGRRHTPNTYQTSNTHIHAFSSMEHSHIYTYCLLFIWHGHNRSYMTQLYHFLAR